jgi:hypothetical protein
MATTRVARTGFSVAPAAAAPVVSLAKAPRRSAARRPCWCIACDFPHNARNVRLFIDPTPGVPPATSNASATLTNLCAFDFDYVQVDSGGESLDVDEFRIATAYEEAAPTVPAQLAIPLTKNIARLRLTGNESQTYSLEATTNLTNWTNIGSGTTTSGTFQFDDTNTVQLPWRFYRAKPLRVAPI